MSAPEAGNAMETVEPRYGDKTVVVRVRFFTNQLAEEGHIIPKNVRAAGWVEMEANPSHGIAADNKGHVKFDSLAEIPAAFEELFVRFGIRVHPSPKMERYLDGYQDDRVY